MSLQFNFGNEFKARVFARAEELFLQGVMEGEVTLTEGRSATVHLWIDRKPDLVLFTAQGVEGPLAGHTIYVGGMKQEKE